MFIKQLQETVKDAFAKKIELDIQSGNSKRFLGRTPKGAALSIAQYSGIVEYDPAELVITVKAGTALRDINSALAKNNQYLPFDAPNFSTESTIGGVVAAGTHGGVISGSVCSWLPPPFQHPAVAAEPCPLPCWGPARRWGWQHGHARV